MDTVAPSPATDHHCDAADAAAALTRFLREHIPVLQSVDVQARVASPDRVVLVAPLQVNRNHHETAFGGSLALLGVVSGWSLLHVALEAEGIAAKLVVQSTQIDYSRPVSEDLRAETCRPADWADFVERLRTRGKGRIDLVTRIAAGDGDGVVLRGRYAAALETRPADVS